MDQSDKEIDKRIGANSSQNVKRDIRSFKTVERTQLKRASDLYQYIVDTLYDHGKLALSVKEVNTNLSGVRIALSTVQTVHRLQRDAGIIAANSQLADFSQTSGDVAAKKRIAKN